MAKLNGKYFDIFDFHWYGNATGDYLKVRDIYEYIKQKIDERDLSPTEGYWITEMGGTYSGDPLPLKFENGYDPPFQTEKQQAIDLVKRYVYSLSIGVEKVFMAFGLKEGFKYDEGYFDFTGFIYDGKYEYDKGKGVKKLSYYTYKLMTEKLEDSDWDNIETVIDGTDNVYAYKFTNQGKPVWVVWWDYFDDSGSSKTITLNVGNINSAKITEAVPNADSGAEIDENDYPNFFKTETKIVSGGNVTITLGGSLVFIEGK
ncbi:MAG TPA: hypothetical protein ENN38_07340 [Actinobacteria bacterium]|nr:hypothetical protein [Actinomycetota bacterium]